MRTPATVGVVGLGAWGPTLARHFDELPQTDLKWLCDHDPARRLALGRRFRDIEWTGQLSDLLEDEELDAVIISTPVDSHRALVHAALTAGKHVFVEKPLATTGGDADELAELARRRNLHLVVAHATLFEPAVIRVKELIDAGTLGQVLYLHASRRSLGRLRADVNVLWSLGPYDLSTVLYLLGDEPTMVSAHGDAYVHVGIVDVVFCHLVFATGIAVHLHLSWLDAQYVRRLSVVGSDRMAVIDQLDSAHTLTVYDQRAVVRRLEGGRESVEVSRGDTVIPHLGDADPVRLQCAQFGELLHARPAPPHALRHAATVAATLAALQRSLDDGGRPTPLAPPPPPPPPPSAALTPPTPLRTPKPAA